MATYAYEIGEAKALIEAQLALIPEMEGLEGNGTIDPSRVQLWDYIKDAIDFASVDMTKKFDSLVTEVNNTIAQQIVGTQLFYADLLKSYQHGDTLTKVNNVLQYNTIDTSKQVADFVNVRVEDITNNGIKYRLVKIKAAKDVNGSIVRLEDEERLGIIDFLDEAGFFGIFVDFITLDPNQVGYDLTVKVDPKVINKDTGKYIDGSGDTPILDAIKNYHDTKNRQDFDGLIYKTKVENPVQELRGVEYAEIDVARYFDGTSWVTFPRFWDSEAGYVEVDESQVNITYL